MAQGLPVTCSLDKLQFGSNDPQRRGPQGLYFGEGRAEETHSLQKQSRSSLCSAMEWACVLRESQG